MRTSLPDGEVIDTPAPGIICHRDRFDRHLAKLAESAGADLITGARAVGIEGHVVTARNGQETLQIKAQVIVGADGPTSTVRSWLGLPRNKFVHGRQYLLPLNEKLDRTSIYFRSYIPGGYGWVFPKAEAANVGVGVDLKYGSSPSAALISFVKELLAAGVITSLEPLSLTGGLIPVGGQAALRQRNIILAGDAAGHCHPVTGAGVPNAMLAGELAGEAAAGAALAGDLELLADYEQSCQMFLGDVLDRAVNKRGFLEPIWEQDDHSLSQALKRSWIAFEEYYKD
jgi:flavin-dependent dehydrogenase